MTHILETKLAYTFSNKKLLTHALTHSSSLVSANYERLEFLGDRVLGLAIADAIFNSAMKGENDEGQMSKRLARLVCRDSLAEVGESLSLFEHMDHKLEVEGSPQERKRATADCCEALLGAIYCDGGWQAAQAVILRLWHDLLHQKQDPDDDNARTLLQEWAQKQNHPLPSYKIIAQKGPDHEPLFDVQVSIAGVGSSIGTGRSKKLASSQAAQKLLMQRDAES